MHNTFNASDGWNFRRVVNETPLTFASVINSLLEEGKNIRIISIDHKSTSHLVDAIYAVQEVDAYAEVIADAEQLIDECNGETLL